MGEFTPAHVAAMYGSLEFLRTLRTHVPSLMNIAAKNGKLPSDGANQRNHCRCEEFLLGMAFTRKVESTGENNGLCMFGRTRTAFRQKCGEMSAVAVIFQSKVLRCLSSDRCCIFLVRDMSASCCKAESRCNRSGWCGVPGLQRPGSQSAFLLVSCVGVSHH